MASGSARFAAAWLAALLSGCAGATSFAPVLVESGSEGTPREVLRVSWRKQLTPSPLVEYKPQEFASAATDGTLVFVGSSGGTFYALRPADGAVGWKKAIPGGVSSQPLYHAESRTVFVGGDDGVLYALDARTGDERWTYRTKGPVGGVPVYDEGLLFFVNGENRVYALDAASGAWKWQYERETPETFTIHGMSSPLAWGGRVYAGFSDGYLATLNARTGDVIWARSLAGETQRFVDVDATPVLVGGVLYTASFSGGVYALDPASGDVKWHYEVEGASSVAVDGDRVYFGAARLGVHCLDLNGQVVWQQALSAQGALSPMVLVRGHLLLSSAAGGTYVVDARSGTLEQFFRPGKGVSAPPVSDGAHVYVLTNAGYFYAFDLRA